MNARFLHKDFPSSPVGRPAVAAVVVPLRDAAQIWLRMILPASEFEHLAVPAKATEIVPIPDEIARRLDEEFSSAAGLGSFEVSGKNTKGLVEIIPKTYFKNPARFNPAEGTIEPGYGEVKFSREGFDRWLVQFLPPSKIDEANHHHTIFRPALAVAMPVGFIRLDEAFDRLVDDTIEPPPGGGPYDPKYPDSIEGLAKQFWNACIEMYQELRLVTSPDRVSALSKDTLTGPKGAQISPQWDLLWHRSIPRGTLGDLGQYVGSSLAISISGFDEWVRATFSNCGDGQDAPPAKKPKIPFADLEGWMKNRVKNWPKGKAYPTFNDDKAEAELALPKYRVTRGPMREVRSQSFVPAAWTNQGPKRLR